MKSAGQLGVRWNKRNSEVDLPPWFPGPMQEQSFGTIVLCSSTAIESANN